MPVTFSTQSHPRVIQLDHIAKSLFHLMGVSDAVPGALRPENVAVAVANLRHGLAQMEETPSELVDDAQEHNSDDDQARPVPLSTRAGPLIELLDAAAASNQHVMWE